MSLRASGGAAHEPISWRRPSLVAFVVALLPLVLEQAGDPKEKTLREVAVTTATALCAALSPFARSATRKPASCTVEEAHLSTSAVKLAMIAYEVGARITWDGKTEQGAEFLQQRLDNRGAVADVLLVLCRDGKTRIVFRTLHAAIDGRGFLHWVSEVCRALRGEPLQGSSSRLTDLDIQARYADDIPEEPAAAPSQCIPVLQPAPAGERGELGYVWRRVVVNKVVPQLLPRTAVFLAEKARQQHTGDVGFTIPVDYRGLRTDEMGLGNLTGYVLAPNRRLAIPAFALAYGALIEVLHEARHPLAIITKSSGVERDLDVLAPMAAQRMASVYVTITTLDPALDPSEIVMTMRDNVQLDSVLSNSFGFGGTNAAVVFKKVT